jgi:glycosyltransferase involved in cell wall biosynthesis
VIHLIIVIPAYQPNERLLQLVELIHQNSFYKIVIVDDGSSKSCRNIFERAQQKGCTVLAHAINKGKGAALKTAFSYILANYPLENIVCADCDGQHSWQDIQKVAKAVSTHQQTIVLGCREFVGTIPLKSLIGNKMTKAIFSVVSGHQLEDTQTGLRGFSNTLLKWLVQVKGDHYEYEMNQLLEAKSAGFEIYSVPIKTIYENNNNDSHFRPILDSIRIYLPLLKFALSSFSCGIIDFVMLFVLNWFTSNLLFSVIGARIISSLCNYIFNKYLVFHERRPVLSKSMLNYYVLVVLILCMNYLLLKAFTSGVHLSLFISKILTEIILFSISFYIQKKIIFKNPAVFHD